ncbi:MAG: M23 family metallopeptidase, partial [Candidatus Riflebacteria bacterium]
MKKILVQLFLLIVSASAYSQTPTWPLDIDISQSSSFAEFRGFRFHAGIDLRTNRQVGYPVRAIEDGFVSRIKVQFRGYGYAIYIDHPKINKRVVYGHLQDFFGPLKEYTDKKLQKIGQRFGIDDFFGPDRFPVKKGQVVALSGETGSGPPHLHFEVRNMADEPEAPAVLGYRPSDKIFPSFHHLYVEPFSYPCEINRSFQTARLSILPARKGWASVSEPLQIAGKVGVKVGISDNNGVGNVYGVESISMALDAKTIFARNFNRYSYDQNSQCSYVYDYIRSNQKGTGYVVNLFKLQGENLPFSAEYPVGAGIINILDKTAAHQLEINVSDFGGNRIMLRAAVEKVEANYDALIPLHEIL